MKSRQIAPRIIAILSLSLLLLAFVDFSATSGDTFSFAVSQADAEARQDLEKPTADQPLPGGASESWYRSAMKEIGESEYEIRWQEKAGAYQSPNRAQNLRFTYHEDGFSVSPRTEPDTWRQTLRLQDFGRSETRQRFSGNTLVAHGHSALVESKALEIHYFNTKEGMRQDFLVKERPTGRGLLSLGLKLEGDLKVGIQADSRGAGFSTKTGELVYQYKGLKVTDAVGQELQAWMQLESGDILALLIQDDNAQYPLLIDPLSTSANWTAESDQASALFGASVATAGDVNGDGYSDVIVGARDYDNGQTDEGRAFVYYGSASGLSWIVNWTAESDQASASFGWSVAAAGDVNGDGYSDVIIGAYQYDNGQTNEGKAFVYHGSASGLSSTANWIAESDQANAYFGTSVATAGDVNGDGYSDVIVGAQYYSNGQLAEGGAFVYHGSATGLSTTANWSVESNQVGAYLGYSVATAGDVNGDGYSDVIAGAYGYDNGQTEEGSAFVYHGSASGLSTTANWGAESDQAYAMFGASVATAGDVNGDGYSDVIIGAYYYDNGQADEGKAFLYHGSASGLSSTANWTAESDQASAYFGVSVATAGDVNGDGYSDVIVGAHAYDNGQTDEGAAFVYHGSVTGLSTTANWSAESNQAGAFFGLSVATAGDIKGDGCSDVIVGAHHYDSGQTDEGKAYVYHGSASQLPTTANWSAESDQASALFGASVATAGDVNGDGYSDVIVGAHAYDNGQTNEGKAFVYHGSASGLSSTANWSAESNQASAFLGSSVATAGDVNGDGYSDVIVGASYYSNGQTNEGMAFVYYGSASGLSATANWSAESNQASAFLGSSVATAGDVNGDGYSDVIVGAWQYDNGQTNEGKAFLYHGSASGLSSTANWTAESDQASAYFGVSVATAGDVNGDGYSDVVIGAHFYDSGQTDEGKAFVHHGSASGLSSTANWTAESNQASANFGVSVATAGDVNGDGYSDVIVGAFIYDNGQTDEGGAFVYHGSASGLSLTANWTAESDSASAYFGVSVATAGDVNGDGYSDVIVGARQYDDGQTDEGRAFVYHGSASGLSPTANWTAESDQANAWFGGSVATAGDVNGDGYSDVIVGAYNYDSGQTDEGKAFVYRGSASGLSSTANWISESDQASAYYGVSVATAGDVNGDGYSDVIIGAPNYDNGQTDEGKAFVYHGSSLGLSSTANWTAESDKDGALFGNSVATAGDVNGDGFSDVIVGAQYYSNGQLAEGRAFVYHGSGSGLSTTPNWSAESDQANAVLGFSVATTGDVNGDGYSDVIVGAVGYSNGQLAEGRAFVYHGSGSGLSTTPNWSAESDQANAWFGWSVAAAGDVNGDGYSDVIIGAPNYDNGQTDEGKAFVYHGSALGLSSTADWTAESDQASASFGYSAATAGDVNGDGYSDVIIGAYQYDNGQGDEGIAFVYHGSASGLSSTPDWSAESDDASAGLGISVASAGDVNGDGYSDVIVGAYYSYNGEYLEGRAFVYHGSASKLSWTANWTGEPDQTYANFGGSVATAGDVNGDGYSDVVVGANLYDNGQTNEGRAFVYYGNCGEGVNLTPRQWRTDLITPVVVGLKTRSSSGAGLGLLARTFFGRSEVKAQFEVKPLGTPFNGAGLTETSSWTDVSTTGADIEELISGLSDRTMYRWRARIKYRLSDGAIQPYGRWLYASGNGGLGEVDFQVSNDDSPLPIEMVSCVASVEGATVELRWTTASEVNNYGFELERRAIGLLTRSAATVADWLKIGFVSGSGTSSSQKVYSYEDKNLPDGRYAYRIKQIDNDGTFRHTEAVEVSVGNVPTVFSLDQNYPNPFNPMTRIRLGIPRPSRVKIVIYNLLGEAILTLLEEDLPLGYHLVEFDGGRFASGVYFYRLTAEGLESPGQKFVQAKKMVLVR